MWWVSAETALGIGDGSDRFSSAPLPQCRKCGRFGKMQCQTQMLSRAWQRWTCQRLPVSQKCSKPAFTLDETKISLKRCNSDQGTANSSIDKKKHQFCKRAASALEESRWALLIESLRWAARGQPFLSTWLRQAQDLSKDARARDFENFDSKVSKTDCLTILIAGSKCFLNLRSLCHIWIVCLLVGFRNQEETAEIAQMTNRESSASSLIRLAVTALAEMLARFMALSWCFASEGFSLGCVSKIGFKVEYKACQSDGFEMSRAWKHAFTRIGGNDFILNRIASIPVRT